MFRNTLLTGIDQLSGLPKISDSQIELMLAYHQLLIKWNKKYNLTAVRDPEEMISRHILDSLTIATYLVGQKFLDVGTGAGLPGIILAILYPQRQFDLLDSNGKKTRFLFQVKTELKLDNVNVFQCRVEQHEFVAAYDGVLSRAFATLADMISGSERLLKPSGNFYAMKGLYPGDEIEQLNRLENSYKVEKAISLTVPGVEGGRHLIVVSRNS